MDLENKHKELKKLLDKTTAELKLKNHELEIETSLERVRAMAMSMQKPDDLADVCQAISEQLEALNVKNIRNVQLAIINKEKKNYANYQYFTAYSKQVFEEPLYGANPSADGMVRAMQKSANSFFVGNIQGKELKEFIEWRKKDDQFPDPLLDESGVVYYYFYSIGKGGLGLTTYKEISAESVAVFKRFHKVFTLAYQRFIDIRQALEQAREAQVEAALERVRAASLAMHKTDELKLVIETVFSQLRELKLPLNACYIDIFEKNNYDLHIWVGTGMKTYPDQLTLPYLDHPLFKLTKNARLKGESFFTIKDSKKSKDRFVRHLAANYDVAQERVDLMLASEGVDMSVALSENVALNVYNYEGIKFSEEENQIIRRFSRVFQQAYTRFLDLKKAEAQARESQIQLALERVRARTMAMQSSEELAEVSYLLNKQVVELGIPTRGCAFNIYNEHDSTEWFSSLEGTIPTYKTPRENFFLKYYEAGRRGETLLVEEYGGERIKKHYKYLATLSTTENSEETIEEDVQVVPEFQIDHVAYFKYGYVLFITLVPAPEAHDIFKRFAKEFEQTYTRFLDLQKAEAQAKEARIEASLERLRSRTMGMQHSDELRKVVAVLYEEMGKLDFDIRQFALSLLDKKSGTVEWWGTGFEESILPASYVIHYREKKLKDNPFVKSFIDGVDQQIPFQVQEYKGEKKKKFDDLTFNHTGLKDLPEKVKNEMRKVPHLFMSNAFMKYGVLEVIGQSPVDKEKSEILQRFARVFEQTYTRFLDLKNAESQARESEIQLALERVRARTMAMQKSEELADTMLLLSNQLKGLGEEIDQISIGVFDEEKDIIETSASIKGNQFKTLHVPIDEPFVMGKIYKAWKRNEKSIIVEVRDEELLKYNRWRNDFLGKKIYPTNQKNGTWVVNAATFSKGLLSFSDEKQASPESLQLLERFAAVFDLTYTRFLDLKNAEAQAREAKIETALEKVRSRSMGMQKSDELNEVIHVIYDQFDHLGIKVDHTGFIVDYKIRDDMLIWLADKNGPLTKIAIPYFDSPHWNSFVETKKNGNDFFANQLDFETKNKFYKKLFNYIPELPKDSKKFYLECPGLAISTVLLNNVGLYIENFSGTPYSEEENNILMRFGKVFQQSYTRFLDLERAEIQALEAQIEASLEKVRNVALSLQKSDEMLKVAQVLYEQLLDLGFSNIRNAIIDIKNGNTDTFTDYDYSHEMSGTITQMSYHDDPTLTGQFKKMASTTNDFFELILEGKELEDLKKMRIKNGEAPDPRLENINVLTYNLYSFGNGAIGISNFGILTEVEKSVLARFSNVFTFAYKRYTDMVQAEQQAREALVELSLERIRAQVTAMQESSDLFDIVVSMRKEFISLGHEADYFWHMQWQPDAYKMWMTSDDGSRIGMVITIPKYVHENIPDLAKWENGHDPVYVLPLDADGAWDYIDNMNKHGHYEKVDPNAPSRDDIRQLGGLTFIMARTTHGEIGFGLPGYVAEPPKESLDTLTRFAGVFDLAYRRFEDLKSAERQNRETQIDLALERVRAKTMAMQKSEELSEVVANLFYQLDDLGIKPYRCNLGIINAKTKYCQLWSTTSDGKVIPLALNIPLTENKHLKKVYNGWKKQSAPLVDFIKGKNRLEWTQYIRKFSDFEEYKPEKINKKKILSEPAILNQVFFKQGFFSIHTLVEMKDEYFDILQRFARVFEQTYTRFLDLQRAEAQASEAVKQASLDRIRGQIASMRTTEDLKQLTPLVWRELKTLEVPFFRCGLFIVDEIKKHVNVYLTTPDGKPLGVLDLDFKANDLALATVASWKKKEVYQTHWNREEFVTWTKEMMHLGQVTVPEKYQGAEEPPESLHLHFIPFAQGMLYVGHVEQLEKEKIDLVKSLAEAFSFAYARYEDFVVLEEAKERVEKALSDLKATQTQLVHAEKMASLGELTAGIAHEIQNPLNFVNNFSEVSTDLIEELMEELQNGDTEEVNAIATDLLQNLEKITHHGKRASDIVKSMLEHSRTGSSEKQPTDLNALADEYLRLAYHGLRAKDKSFNADFKLEADKDLPKVNVVAQDVGRVLLNLINNAFFAVSEKAKQNPENYKPQVIVTTSSSPLEGGRGVTSPLEGGQRGVSIRVKDNGPGIPPDIKEKIFQPFFTTKPTGQGTGLGLSMSYDIIKAHGGEIIVDTNENDGTRFTILLPKA